MSRLYTCGWETGSVNEMLTGLTATVTGDNMGVVTSPVRSGSYSLKVDYSTTASTDGRATQITVGAGSTNTLFIRTYLYITSAVTERCEFIRTNSVSTGVGTRGSISLNTDSTIQIYNGASAVGSASSALALNSWYRVELSSICNATNQIVTLLLNGSTVASAQSFANTNADSTVVQLGWSATGTAGPTKSGTFYLDDFAVNYEGGTAQTSYPGDAKLLMLLPVADSAVGTGWTLGTGTATGGNAFAALDNTPPQGVADLTAGSDTKQVRNAASAANSNLDLAVTDYATAGIASGDTINLVNAVVSTAAPSGTSPKVGAMMVVSNPAGASASIGNFYSGAIAGTYPTGWVSGAQSSTVMVYGDIASGNRSTRPVVRITQTTASTRIAMVDFVGLYVDYTPAVAIALVSTPTTAVGASITATTVSITVPTGSIGDLLVLNVSAAAVSTSVTPPVITSATAGLTSLFNTYGTWYSAALLFRLVQAGDPTSYTFTVNAGAPYEAICARYSGVSSITPFRFLNSSTTNVQGTSTASTITFPTVNNVVSTDLTLCAVSMGTNTSNTTQATALSTPTSWTNVVSTVGPTNGITSSLHSATALYSRAAGVDTPAPTGSTGQYSAVSFVLVAASNMTVPAPGGQIRFVNAATASPSANSATTVCNVPTGVVNGNVMLALVANPGGSSLSAPAGWTPLMETNAWVSQGVAGTYSDGVSRMWYRVASSEPANYTFTSTLANHGAPVIIAAYSGTRFASPVLLSNAVYSTGPGVTASTTSPAPYLLNQMTAITTDMLIVDAYAAGGDSSGLVTITNPGGAWTGRATAASTVSAAFNSAIGIVDKFGATDVPTATSSVTSGWSVFSVALIGESAHNALRTVMQAVNRASTY